MKHTPFVLGEASLEPGTTLLEASAGTGKTYNLVGLLLRFLVEGRIERLEQALVVTFTVAATEELKNRVRAALAAALRADGDDAFLRSLARQPGARARLRAALDEFDRASILTIHGFCKRLLEQAAFEVHAPFALEFTADPLPLLYQAAGDALRGQYEREPSVRSALLHELELTPKTLVEHYRLWQRYPDVRLEPTKPDAARALAALDAAVLGAVAAWDDDVLDRFAEFQWLKDKNPFDGDRTSLEVFGRRLVNETPLVFGLLRTFGRTHLAARLKKRPPPRLDHEFFGACDAVADAAADALEHLRVHLLHAMHERLAATKRDAHVLTFDDLLARTHEALEDPERRQMLRDSLRARYRVALIDEFQDTDPLQYEIFAQCFSERPLFLVGDPKQSIYAFRGADVHVYLAASRDALRTQSLPENWRSSDGLVRAVNGLFRGPHAFAIDGIAMPAVRAAARSARRALTGDPGAPLCWRFLRGDGDEMLPRDVASTRIVTDVAAEISRLLRSGATINGERIAARHIAVLTRKNVEAIAVQDALRAASVPSAIGKAGDIFRTDEIEELELFLRAVLTPGDVNRVRAALATRLWGFDGRELDGLRGDEAALDRQIERLDRWRRTWLRRGFVTMAEQVLVDLAVHKRFLAQLGGERRLTNLRQLFELLHEAEQDGRLSPEGLVEWLEREQRHQEDIDYTLRELRLESDGDAVHILTVHGSKGLEYEIVFCPFLWDGGRPRQNEVVREGDDPDDEHVLALGLKNGHPAMPRAQAERLAEDLRLAYVALTRARVRCYVHWGNVGTNQSGAWRSALAWMLAKDTPTPGHDPDGHPCDEWVEVFQQLARSRCAHFERELVDLCAASEGTMTFELVPDEPTPVPWRRAAPRPLPPALVPRRKPRARGLFSYSSLIAAAAAAEPGPDRDDRCAPLAVPAPSRGIFAFARGASAGQCLHHLLERVDFAQLDAPATTELVRATLEGFALLAPDAHAGEIDPVADVVQNLRDVAAARLHVDGPTMRSLCAGSRAVEWQFTLRACDGSLQQLAKVFAECPSAIARAQAQRLVRLPDTALHGFLIGFVDLLAEHEGRYWVVDWKSNHLGDVAADYVPDALERAMCEHDYVLQYHLYVLALHRLLRARLRDYDYERHVGGVCYAFLRGAVPDTANGMFFDRVPKQLVLAMDDWLDGRVGGGAR